MNPILDYMIEVRKGHYCHCVEVSEVYDLECIAEAIINEFQYTYTEADIIEFLSSLDVYCLNDENEKEIFNFSFTEHIKDTI